MVDYALARRATLASVFAGHTTVADVCDAHPYLLRAAKFHGEATETGCPICRKSRLTHVTYVYGDELGRYEGRVSNHQNSLRWPPNMASSGSTWSRSVKVVGGTTSLRRMFSARASHAVGVARVSHAAGVAGRPGPANESGLVTARTLPGR